MKLPFVEAFKTHWTAILRVALCSLSFAVSTVIGVFGLAYATKDGGSSSATDRLGRKPVFVTGSVVLVALVASALIGITYGAVNAIYPAFFTEMFSLRVRTTGMAVGLQVGLVASGFSPAIASLLVGNEHANWTPVAIMSAAASLIAAVAALTARETFLTPLDQLGQHTGR